jgi:hypothetical protein
VTNALRVPTIDLSAPTALRSAVLRRRKGAGDVVDRMVKPEE